MDARPLHPDTDHLAAFGNGRLVPTEAEVVERHLDDCPACGGRVDELTSDPFLAALRDAADGGRTPAVTVIVEETIPAELASHPRYRLGELLGRGGMGSVYKAEHTLMGRTVALKVIAPRLLEHPGAAERFKQEVRAAAKLHHPNIVTAHDAEELGSVTVLVMEYVKGRSLADVLHDRGPLPVAEACEYARQAAVGLAHAHGLGMVHRDIKPHNLMLTPDGRVKILDFGLARFVAEEFTDPPAATAAPAEPAPGLTHTGACLGTLDYMAPEQATDARGADARADIYSLGCTLYHLLAGQVPFPGGTGPDKLTRLRDDAPTPLAALRPDVPDGVARLVDRMMAKRPDARFGSASEVVDALALIPRRAPRRRLLAGAMVSLVAAVVAGVFALKPPAEVVEPAPPVAQAVAPLPAELNLIPRHAAGFVSVRVGDLTRIPSQAWVWTNENNSNKDLDEPDGPLAGVRPDNILRATVVWPTAERPDPNIEHLPPEVLSRLLVLTRAEPFPPTHPAFAGGKTWEEYRGRRYALDRVGWTAYYPADPHTLVIGTRASVRFLLDHLADPKPGPLDDAVRAAAEAPGPIALGLNGRPFTLKQLDPVPWLLSPPKPFPGVPAVVPSRFALTLDCRTGLDLDIRAGFTTAAAAEEGRAALAGICAHNGRIVGQLAKQFGEQIDKVEPADPQGPNSPGMQLYRRQIGFYSEFAAALTAAAPRRDGTTVRLALRAENTLAFEEALAESVSYVYSPRGSTPIDDRPLPGRDAAVAAALVAYRAEHGRFPPPAVLSKEGKPLLSWRVAVLPYLGAEAAALHRRFRLTEPWDSPHNRPLLDQMPAVFSTEIVVMPVRPRPQSGYRMFAGEMGEVVAVRQHRPVPWTRPDAVPAADMSELPAAVILADGSVHVVPHTHDLAAVRAAIVGRGRYPIPKPPEPPPAVVPNRQLQSLPPPPAERPAEVAPAPRPVKPIPAELDLIPRDAAGFLTVPVQEVMTAPVLAWGRQRAFEGAELAEIVKAMTRLDLKDLRRATVIWPTAEHTGANILAVPPELPSRVLVLTSAELIAKSHPEITHPDFLNGKHAEEYRGRRYAIDADGWTAFFPAGDRTLVIGSRAAVRLVIDRLADSKPGPLDAAVAQAGKNPERIVIGLQGPKFRGRLAEFLPPDVQLAAPAYSADRVALNIDLRDGLAAEFAAEFPDEPAARAGRDALRAACAAGDKVFDDGVKQIAGAAPAADREVDEVLREFATQTRDALKSADVRFDGTGVRLRLHTKSGFALAQFLPVASLYVLAPAGPMIMSYAAADGNDKVVARALMAYHAKHGRFPPPAVLSKEGKPLLSWRVALLPHLGDEAAALYKKFNLEEAWDSPANKKLLDQMPAELCTDPFKTDYRPRPRTGYRVYTAKGSVFEGPGGLSKTDITDDPAATILAVRSAQPVPWTKPDQLTFDNLESVPSAAIFADGAVRRLAENEDPNTLKALITRAGGEKAKPKSDPQRP